MRLSVRTVTAIVTAIAVEAAAVVLARIVALPPEIALVGAFTVGYLTLCIVLSAPSPTGGRPSLRDRLRETWPFGLGALLLVQAMVYLCNGLLSAGLAATNAAALIAVAGWIVVSRRFVTARGRDRDEHHPSACPDAEGADSTVAVSTPSSKKRHVRGT